MLVAFLAPPRCDVRVSGAIRNWASSSWLSSSTSSLWPSCASQRDNRPTWRTYWATVCDDRPSAWSWTTKRSRASWRRIGGSSLPRQRADLIGRPPRRRRLRGFRFRQRRPLKPLALDREAQRQAQDALRFQVGRHGLRLAALQLHHGGGVEVAAHVVGGQRADQRLLAEL